MDLHVDGLVNVFVETFGVDLDVDRFAEAFVEALEVDLDVDGLAYAFTKMESFADVKLHGFANARVDVNVSVHLLVDVFVYT